MALRGLIYQLLAVLVLLATATFLLHNTLANMRARGIQSGFDFLLQPAGFSIGESLFEFDSSESYLKAFAVGLSNTFRVALIGIALATGLGTLIGVGRLSRNLLLRTLCGAYVDLLRNVPLLLQLFIWYFMLTEMLPPVDAALQPLPDVFLSKNGLQFPIPVWEPGQAWTLGGLGLERPEKTEINLVGGGAVTPEYLTVLIGLSSYTAAYIAEVVRAGLQSVPWGQLEAARALGLSRRQELRLVLLPQALRVIIPPLTNQYLNLTKNSSLAVAVGYPDLVSISNTSLNQTGRAIECIAVVMGCYLTLSLLTSAAMNLYHRRTRLRER
ncbi:MAG: putative glutamine transporter permease protein GlnM [Pseudomonadota bacterium]|jgi:general L-amino acid transport system permease protein